MIWESGGVLFCFVMKNWPFYVRMVYSRARLTAEMRGCVILVRQSTSRSRKGACAQHNRAVPTPVSIVFREIRYLNRDGGGIECFKVISGSGFGGTNLNQGGAVDTEKSHLVRKGGMRSRTPCALIRPWLYKIALGAATNSAGGWILSCRASGA